MKTSLRWLMALFVLVTAPLAQAAPGGFDPIEDCKAQPYGLGKPFDPANDPFPGMTGDQEPSFLAAEDVRDLFLQAAQPILGDQAETMIDALKGACLSKKGAELFVSVYLKRRFSLSLKPRYQAATLEAYQLEFPEVLRARITRSGKFVSVSLPERYFRALQVLVNVPILSDRIFLHRLRIDTETGWIRVSANALNDEVGLVAWSRFVPGKPVLAWLEIGGTLGRIFRPRSP